MPHRIEANFGEVEVASIDDSSPFVLKTGSEPFENATSSGIEKVVVR